MWMTIREFQETCFTKGSRPTRNTVVKWIEDGVVVGKKFGGQWYIYIGAKRPAKEA